MLPSVRSVPVSARAPEGVSFQRPDHGSGNKSIPANSTGGVPIDCILCSANASVVNSNAPSFMQTASITSCAVPILALIQSLAGAAFRQLELQAPMRQPAAHLPAQAEGTGPGAP